jgi:ATP-binding cassette subfamily B protein
MATLKRINSWKLLKALIDYAQELYLIDAFFWLFIMGLPLIPGLIIREFFNTLTDTSQLELSPEAWIVLFLATGFGRVIFIFIGRVTKTQHRFTVSALVRRNLFASVLNRPGAMPMLAKGQGNRPISIGEAISYFRDDTDLIEDNVVGTSEVFDSGIFALVALVILLTINARMTLFVFLPLVGIIIAITQAKARIKQYRQASRKATEQVTGLIGEIFHSVQAIKVAGAEEAVLHHFHQLNSQRRQTILKDRLFTAILQSVFQNLVSLGTGGVLLLAATSMHDGGTLTVGDFALFIYYLSFITEFVTFLGQFLTSTKQTEVSFERMEALVSTESRSNAVSALVAHNPLYLPDIWGRKPQLPAIPQPNFAQRDCLQELTVSNLTYFYPGTDQGITNVNFTLRRGSLTVITGRIGAGKTTLLRVLLGLLPKQAGEIYWNDRLVTDPANFFTPPRSAYTPQVPQLFSDSLGENILLGLQKSDTEMTEAMKTAVFDQDVATMPAGLETLVGVKGVRLSGGQLQRAAATRMLVRQPELLVFDDLSSALDVETEQKLWDRLLTKRSVEAGWIPTCLVVSHRPYLLHHADQVIVLGNGNRQLSRS